MPRSPQPSDTLLLLLVEATWPAEASSTTPGCFTASLGALSDLRELPLRESTSDLHEEPSARRGGVDRIVEAHEPHPKLIELSKEREKVAEVAAETVELPDQDAVEPSSASVGQETIQCRTLSSSTADTLVEILRDDLEASGLGILAKSGELNVDGLLGG